MKTIFTLLFIACGFVAFAQSPINYNLRKGGDSTLVYTVKDTATRSVSFTARYLKDQRKAIVAQKKTYDDQRNIEIAQIDSLLVQFKRLGIKQ